MKNQYEIDYQQGYDTANDEWLERMNKIRAEITAIAINGQVDEYTAFIRTGEQVKRMALNIIDKYSAESEE